MYNTKVKGPRNFARPQSYRATALWWERFLHKATPDAAFSIRWNINFLRAREEQSQQSKRRCLRAPERDEDIAAVFLHLRHVSQGDVRVGDVKKCFGDRRLEGWLALQRLWSPVGDDQETSARTIDSYIDVQSRGNFATSHPDNHLCGAEMETGPSRRPNRTGRRFAG